MDENNESVKKSPFIYKISSEIESKGLTKDIFSYIVINLILRSLQAYSTYMSMKETEKNSRGLVYGNFTSFLMSSI